MCMAHLWNETNGGENDVLRVKPIQPSRCPPRIPHRVAGNRTLFSTVRGRQLSACAIEWLARLLHVREV